MNSPLDRRTAQRIPYAEASRVLLRDSILDGMRELLLTRDWSAITLSDVARAAGISRQTIYNEFGSRQGLAQGYALRLADRLVDAVDGAIQGNVGDIYAAFQEGFRAFFTESVHPQLGSRQRGGRGCAGPGDRPAVHELHLNAAGGRPRRGP